MAGRDDETTARAERARAIGLFRYQLIREAADPRFRPRPGAGWCAQIAAREHTDPFGRRVRSPATPWTGGSGPGGRAGSTRWCPPAPAGPADRRPRCSRWRWR